MKFWQEVRRRKVFRFTGVYIVGAWLVFQVADVFFPAWGIPDSSLQYLLYAAFACFPVALIFSWFYDVSARGITRTPKASVEATPDYALGRMDYLLLAGLLIVAGTIFYNSFGRVVQSVDTAETAAVPANDKPENSLAVLPFDSLDTSKDTGYFSAGVSEEIMHRLASVRTLKVIGRKSSFAFGESDMGLDRISDLLGVRYLLDGSIRRAGDQVRVTARLVDETGFQVWSETFDGNLAGIFDFQTEIAETVASEITRELVDIGSALASSHETNSEAYRQFLIGREFFTRRTPNWQAHAVESFKNSMEADALYAPPIAHLAMVLMMGGSKEPWDVTKAESNRLIAEALELDPLLAEGWMAKGFPDLDDPEYDPEEAGKHLEYALELNPLLITAYNWLSISFSARGDLDGMFSARERGLAVDPLNPVLLMNSADIFLANNNFDGWKGQIMKLLELPSPPVFVNQVLSTKHQEYGHYVEAVEWLKQRIRTDFRPESTSALLDLALLYERLGMPDLATHWMQMDISLNENDLTVRNYAELKFIVARGEFDGLAETLNGMAMAMGIDLKNPPGPALKDSAWLQALSGDYDSSIPLLQRFLDLKAPVKLRFNNAEEIVSLQLLAHCYEQSGMTESAHKIMERAELKTRNIFELGNFTSAPINQILPAMNLAARGKTAESAKALKTAVEAGWKDYYAERHMPYWRGAWESEAFAPVIEIILAELAKQRSEMEAIEAENDFRAELEAQMAGS